MRRRTHIATRPTRKTPNGRAEVDAWMRELAHPRKAEIEALRAIIRGANRNIAEGIKWNAPSFYFKDYFATFNPRARDGVQVILHMGAKVRESPPGGLMITDDAGLLAWLAKDRASLKLADMQAIASNRASITSIVRQWIALLG